MKRLLAILLMFPLLAHAEWQEVDEARLQHLLGQLKCIVCSGQSLKQSDAVLAQDIRVYLKEQIEAGVSDEDIMHSLAARYGDQILFSPPLNGSTALLWFAPLILLSAGGIVLYRARKGGTA